MKKIIKNTILAAVFSLSSFSIAFADGPHHSGKSDLNIQEEAMIDFHQHMIIQVYDSEGNLLAEGRKGDAVVNTLINNSEFITKAGNILYFVFNENQNIPELSITTNK